MKKKILFMTVVIMALTGSYIYTTNAANNAALTKMAVAAEPEPMKPKFISRPIEDQRLKEGETIQVVATVVGVPFPRIGFFRDGERINANDRTTISIDPKSGQVMLTIKKAKTSDSGVYKILAENDRGVADETCNITVYL